ncbi:TIGR01777 family protein [Budviciaceae bacterium BWR-B9]|uniref:TIGR01777 family protein n=1 Tax=Limnobaculum allomyrinae TaxID=2791986 RepID=A0ABS1IUB4_9GAMM|nr:MULTISPECIES: TIGR01777 family oxidoreductase [Limnobaculum]MBK5145355.1 TIGR01777 family protein [Limnobaculum allomyrinae]MBV7693217.1 TIGR01777 family oxidoreductase [Limnobaculum sp. M2-1]
MHILITGATGLIGRHLTKSLLLQSHTISVVSRNIEKARAQFGDSVSYLNTLDNLKNLDNFDAVINLAGEPIADKRWTAVQKRRLCNSRWQLTAHLSKLFLDSHTPPAVFISGSAVGYYGDQGQSVVTEDEPPHPEFTHTLCQRWEEEALLAKSDRTRVCLLRTGIVLSTEGGALSKMLPIFKMGLGGPLGSGLQYMPWIHINDMVNAIQFLLTTPKLEGPFNMVSPYPVHNELFTDLLASAIDRPHFFRTPAFVIRLLMGESAVLVLGGQHALPKRLEEAGYHFEFNNLEKAFEDLFPKS